MNRFAAQKMHALHDLQQSGLPRHVVKQLVDRLGVGIGGRVLVAGRDCGRLARLLSGLGIDVAGIDDSGPPLRPSTTAGGDLEIVAADPETAVPFPGRSFDAVIAGDLAAYRRSLHSPATLRTTANLLSTLRPGGKLAVVLAADGSALHRPQCFERHLQTFGDDVETIRQTEGFLARWNPWRKEPGCRQTIFTAPAALRTRQTWLQLAAESTLHPSAMCCPAFAHRAPAALSEAA